jgi:S-(hydroxymethyl)glutathione dehydrogenase/alcohol dehydrogenase
MKAAILYKSGGPLSIEHEIVAPKLKRGQVMVKLVYSGVCHSQLKEVRGHRGPDPFLPHMLGHEGSGVVLEVGEGVKKVKKGDRVILGWIKGLGLEGGGSCYQNGETIINAGGVTTFGDHAIVSENRVVLLPAGIPMDIAVLFGCAIPTGAGIITNEIQPLPGSTIAIFGLGGIGLSALMATMLYKCEKVIAVDISASKLELASEFGASHLINASEQNVLNEIRILTEGNGVDYAVEASGLCEVIEIAFSSVRSGGGLCIFASHPEYGKKICIDPFELICGKQIRGTWGGSCKPDIDIPKFAQLYLEGRLPLDKLITKRYTLNQINEALDDLEQMLVARPLIKLDMSGGDDLS